MNDSLEKRLADTRAAHEVLLSSIAAFKANPLREARAKVDAAAMISRFDPELVRSRPPIEEGTGPTAH